MANDDQGAPHDRVEEHSLPGTDQAGKGPRTSEDEPKNRSKRNAEEQDRLEKHSLPGTNQAGKGPSDGPD